VALSGSLKEFELPDIFQLIGQQKKSGRLLLTDGDRQGFAVFSQGSIVSAGSDRENLISTMARYLTRVKRYPEAKIEEFVAVCKGSPSVFADVVLKIQYIGEDELQTLASSSIEDLACNLFLWRKGNYRFEPLQAVDDQAVTGIAHTTDAIAMEAMRRADEWQRMQETVNDRTVFALTDPDGFAADLGRARVAPLSNPSAYLLSMLNGRRSVEDLVRNSFLCQYRVYEILFQALNHGHVRVAAAGEIPTSATIHMEAVARAEEKNAPYMTLAVLSSAFIVLIVFLLAFLVLPRVIFSERTGVLARDGKALSTLQASRKMTIGALEFHAQNGVAPETYQDLRESDILPPRDVIALKQPVASPSR
jgi:hypothetical protein